MSRFVIHSDKLNDSNIVYENHIRYIDRSVLMFRIMNV